MAMDPAILERKKDRKGSMAYDQGLEKVEKKAVTLEQQARKEKRQRRKVERFARTLKSFDIDKEIDDYLKGFGQGEWDKQMAKVMGVPPVVEQALELKLIEPPGAAHEAAASDTSSSRVSDVVSSGDEEEAGGTDKSNDSEDSPTAGAEGRELQAPVEGESTPVADEQYSAEREDRDNICSGERSPLGQDLTPEREQELMEDQYGVGVVDPDSKLVVIGSIQKKRKWMEENRLDLAKRWVVSAQSKL